jgi:mRNA interferase RelE/StbE
VNWGVAFSRRAERDLDRIPKREAAQLRADLEKLAADPLTREVDVKKLQPLNEGVFRIRVGNYRLLFTFDKADRTLRAQSADDRKDIY